MAVDEKASEYPQKNHWKMTTALLADTAHIRDTTEGCEDSEHTGSNATHMHSFCEQVQSTERLDNEIQILNERSEVLVFEHKPSPGTMNKTIAPATIMKEISPRSYL